MRDMGSNKREKDVMFEEKRRDAFSRTHTRAHSRSFYVFAVTSVTEIIIKHYGTMICDSFITFI